MSSSRTMQSPCGSSQQMEQLKATNHGGLCDLFYSVLKSLWLLFCAMYLEILNMFSPELRGRVSELERSLSTHEKDIRNQAAKLQELQTQLNQARKELTERDRDLVKSRHEMSQATDKHQQAESKVGFHVWYTDFTMGSVVRSSIFV